MKGAGWGWGVWGVKGGAALDRFHNGRRGLLAIFLMVGVLVVCAMCVGGGEGREGLLGWRGERFPRSGGRSGYS